jgi:type II secretory pathway pseudopilin PulG
MEYRPTRRSGFSLLELLICMAVMMVVTVAAIPTISRTFQAVKLQSSAQEFATLLQRARILAVKNNTTYSIVVPAAVNGMQQACIDTNYNGTCEATEPMVALSSNVSLITDGSGPSTNQITCGALTTACPAGFTGLNYFNQPATAFASYNNRGLPCVGNPATTEPNPGNTACKEIDPNGRAVGFLFEFQYSNGTGTTYATVTVTPSGLVSEWSYNGSSWGQQ